jgi:hypothetical protein
VPHSTGARQQRENENCNRNLHGVLQLEEEKEISHLDPAPSSHEENLSGRLRACWHEQKLRFWPAGLWRTGQWPGLQVPVATTKLLDARMKTSAQKQLSSKVTGRSPVSPEEKSARRIPGMRRAAHGTCTGSRKKPSGSERTDSPRTSDRGWPWKTGWESDGENAEQGTL